jgi:chromosome segregation ATPase
MRSAIKKASSASDGSSKATAAATAARVAALEVQLKDVKAKQLSASSKAKGFQSQLADEQESRLAYERETNRVLGLYNELQKEGKELYQAYSAKAAKVKDLSSHVRSLEQRLVSEVRTPTCSVLVLVLV